MMFCGLFRKRIPLETADYSQQNLRDVPVELFEHRQSLQRLYLNTNQLRDLSTVNTCRYNSKSF